MTEGAVQELFVRENDDGSYSLLLTFAGHGDLLEFELTPKIQPAPPPPPGP